MRERVTLDAPLRRAELQVCVSSSLLQISLQELVTGGQRKHSSATLLVELEANSSANGYLCYLINIRLIPVLRH